MKSEKRGPAGEAGPRGGFIVFSGEQDEQLLQLLGLEREVCARAVADGQTERLVPVLLDRRGDDRAILHREDDHAVHDIIDTEELGSVLKTQHKGLVGEQAQADVLNFVLFKQQDGNVGRRLQRDLRQLNAQEDAAALGHDEGEVAVGVLYKRGAVVHDTDGVARHLIDSDRNRLALVGGIEVRDRSHAADGGRAIIKVFADDVVDGGLDSTGGVLVVVTVLGVRENDVALLVGCDLPHGQIELRGKVGCISALAVIPDIDRGLTRRKRTFYENIDDSLIVEVGVNAVVIACVRALNGQVTGNGDIHLRRIAPGGVDAGAQAVPAGLDVNIAVDRNVCCGSAVDAAAGQVAASASSAATANADGSAAAQQLSSTFATNFDFSNAEGAAAQGVADTAAAAAENADGTPIADKLNQSTQAGIDTSALNAPAEEMVRNAQAAAKAIDVSDIGKQFSSSAASGMDTSAISDKMSAITKAANAASTTVKIGVQADTSGIKAVTAAAASIPGAFSGASAKAVASLGQISTKAASVAASVKQSINSIPSSKTITLNFSKPHIPVPHWSMSGSFNPKTGSTPSVSTWWGAEGGILTKATIFGAGEAGPEAVLPLTKLEKMLDESNGKYQGGGDTYNVTIYAQPGDGPEELATAFTQAIETRNRMRGRTTARKAVRTM